MYFGKDKINNKLHFTETELHKELLRTCPHKNIKSHTVYDESIDDTIAYGRCEFCGEVFES